MSKPVILTGLRANKDLHIGNYFGGLLPLVNMAKTRADDYQINLFVPDLHSFTTPIDHSKLQTQIMHTLKLFTAAGVPLDHPNLHIYRQSHIPAHSELTWILDCFTGMGEMSRMTQFKDKSASIGGDRVRVGLFNYPVLMAPDILLYNAIYVPVGDDQTQHLEYTRDIAQRMNGRFNRELFTVPKAVEEQHEFFGKEQGLRIKDLVEPIKKMSKSSESDRGVVFLTDDPQTARKKVMSATTDDFAEIKYDPSERPGISNLLEIMALLRETSLNDVIGEFSGQTSYGEFKSKVADETANFLTGFQERLNAVDHQAITYKLAESEAAMSETANQTLYRVQEAVGLR